MTAQQISKLIERLQELGLNPQCYRNTQYNDEPRFFNYNTTLKITSKNTGGIIKLGEPHGSGVSYFQAEDALSKSIWEAMERFCNYSWHKKQIIYRKKGESSKFLDLSFFSKDPVINKKKLGWVEGWDLFANQKTLIPAQLVYLNYKKPKNEPYLDYPHNSTGSAAGASFEHAILNGIYEIIERDSLVGVYLNKISPPIIDLSALKDKRIDYLVNLFKKFNLELYVLDTTTDLSIPSFIGLLFDRSGRGPAVGIGAKAGFRTNDAIVGAIGEVLMTRLYTKNMLSRGEISPDLKSATGHFPNRARLWITQETIGKIDFLIKGRKTKLKHSEFRGNLKAEFSRVIKIIQKRGYKIYYRDCTIDEFRNLGFFTYFTFIPGLQPLYLHEQEREKVANIRRLSQIANYFGQEFDGVNQVPHPFL